MEEALSSKIYHIFVNITLNITLNKVTKEAVDQSNPGSALVYLKFIATLKDTTECSNLVLPFNGMRDNEPIVIASCELQQIQNTTAVNVNYSIESKNKNTIAHIFNNIYLIQIKWCRLILLLLPV